MPNISGEILYEWIEWGIPNKLKKKQNEFKSN